MWRRAREAQRCSELGAASHGAPEHVDQMAAASASSDGAPEHAPGGPTINPTGHGAAEHGIVVVTSSDILMQVDDIPTLQSNCELGREALHSEARDLLNFLSTPRLGFWPEASEKLDEHWPHWKEYIAFHKDGARLVGSGIVGVSGQHIEGTRDANRSNALRFDFVLHHRDGGYVRIHPGSKPKLDAQPKYFPSSATEHVGAASLQWMQLPPSGIFTMADAFLVPVTDRIGHKRAWDILGSLEFPADRDLTDGSKFLWWLWVANLASREAEIVGPGIVGAHCTAFYKDQDAGHATVEFTRADDSVSLVSVSHGRSHGREGRMKVQYRLQPV